MDTIAVYIHLPWCVRKCPYCDFNSYGKVGTLPEREYVRALVKELELVAARVPGARVGSVFFGGGTPSLFSPAAIGEILNGLDSVWALQDAAEVTLEANPGAADTARFHGYRDAGVNRLSIGVQTFDDDHLARIGRVHDGADALAAVHAAGSAGFSNFNIDLMYGLPGQGITGAVADVEQALKLAPEHLSWYQLTIEPNTQYARKPPTLPNDDKVADIEAEVIPMLAEAGLRRYEVSAFSRAGSECRHNLNYWQFGDYVGLGAGAHSKRRFAGEVWRWHAVHSPNRYLELAGTTAAWRSARIPPDAALDEFIMNAFRLVNGFDPTTVPERTGASLARFYESMARIPPAWLDHRRQRLAASPVGRRLLNELLIRASSADAEAVAWRDGWAATAAGGECNKGPGTRWPQDLTG